MFDRAFSQQHFDLDDSLYLNAAYMGPLSHGTKKQGEYGIYTKVNPIRITAKEFFSYNDNIRQLAANILNTDAYNIAIIPSVSYGMATIARNISFKPGQNIVLVQDEMPSNVYIWQEIAKQHQMQLRIVAPTTSDLSQIAENWNQKIFQAIDDQTALVAIGNVHWITGAKFDLSEIRARTLAVGALLIVDGTQSIGVLPLDILKLKPDAVVVAAYKWLLGPYSMGFMYLSDQFLNGTPLEYHWLNRNNSQNFESLTDYQDKYQPGAMRFDVGESSNFILAPMLENALKEINDWGVKDISKHCEQFTMYIESELTSLGLSVIPSNQRGSHFLGIFFDSTEQAKQIQKKLAENNVFTSVRRNIVRVTPHVYNPLEQAAIFLKQLKSACTKLDVHSEQLLVGANNGGR